MNKRNKSTIYDITEKIITEIYDNKAALAGLRDSQTILDVKAQVVWPYLFSRLNFQELSKDGKPTYAENAIFYGLRSYAIYQQGSEELLCSEDPKFLHGKNSDKQEQKGISLFSAFNKLRNSNEKMQPALDSRINRLLASPNTEAILYNLIQSEKILKSKLPDLKIDFAELAENIFWLQMSSDLRKRICLKWGQDYYWSVDEIAVNKNKGE